MRVGVLVVRCVGERVGECVGKLMASARTTLDTLDYHCILPGGGIPPSWHLYFLVVW